MEKDEEGARALDLLNAHKDLPVSLKVLTETGCGKVDNSDDDDSNDDEGEGW